MKAKGRKRFLAGWMIAAMALASAGCAEQQETSGVDILASQKTSTEDISGTLLRAGSRDSSEYMLYENSADGEHAITADGEEAQYDHIKVIKTGEAEGDEADFYGSNSAIFATNKGKLTLSDIDVQTNGTHANAVFSYGEGTEVDISDSVINTEGNCSGGLMTTGGGTMNARDLQIHTTGNSSAAIRSDRGGGTVDVTGGEYITDGKGSPVIYSTADITVSDAELTSTASQGVVVEGKNSVSLNDVVMTACNNTKNSDKSDYYQAVMIYQSMSGDADEGLAAFSMRGGSLVNQNGDIFFVNNTCADIYLEDADIENEDAAGVFLRAAAAGWGNEGSNGGHVNLRAENQSLTGDMLVDEISTLNLYLSEDSGFNGAINPDGKAGEVYVELSEGSVWELTGDSYISALTCEDDSIELNGHKLYVNGKEYSEGTVSEGEPIEVEIKSGGGSDRPERPGEGNPPDGNGPEGNPPTGKGPEGNPPDGKKPEGNPPAGFPGGKGPEGSDSTGNAGGPGGGHPGKAPGGSDSAGRPGKTPEGSGSTGHLEGRPGGGKPGEKPGKDSSSSTSVKTQDRV